MAGNRSDILPQEIKRIPYFVARATEGMNLIDAYRAAFPETVLSLEKAAQSGARTKAQKTAAAAKANHAISGRASRMAKNKGVVIKLQGKKKKTAAAAKSAGAEEKSEAEKDLMAHTPAELKAVFDKLAKPFTTEAGQIGVLQGWAGVWHEKAMVAYKVNETDTMRICVKELSALLMMLDPNRYRRGAEEDTNNTTNEILGKIAGEMAKNGGQKPFVADSANAK